jgi:hypothetical protein
MRLSWATGATLLVFVGSPGCMAGTESNVADVSGHWEFTETLEDKVHGFSCADTGTYEISQLGDQFVGRYAQTGVCRTPSGLVSNEDSGTVEAGRVIGRTIHFMVTASCSYEGSAAGMPTSTLMGKGLCVLNDGTRTISLNGTWQATR